MKKSIFVALGLLAISSNVLSESKLAGQNTSSLTHEDIFKIYLENNVIYDQNNMPQGYDGDITAVYMTLNKVRGRLQNITSDINREFLYSSPRDEDSRSELIDIVESLIRTVDKLQRLRSDFLSKPESIDKYYARSVNISNHTKRVMRKTEKIISTGDIRSGYANEINFISDLLKNISYGYRNKSLTLILARGDTSNSEKNPYSERLNLKF